ncbi:MAG: phosphomevalonate kinase [Candidatus Nealsonbacteria bacterium]|nr:phosphomevalonate kinase [Candidatus Nealsonbacteria bacterium]
MENHELIVSAPGKVCIAGEWAVLEKGNPLVVAAVDRRIFAGLRKSSDNLIHITLRDFGIEDVRCDFKKGKISFAEQLGERQKKHLSFISSALESVLQYAGFKFPFQIETWGERSSLQQRESAEDLERKKMFGFGASAASVVAVVAGVLKLYGEDIAANRDRERVYKLSAVAHYLAQGKVGSGFDVAASTFGGILVYKRFDPDWLKEQIGQGQSLREILKMKWPGFYYRTLQVPEDTSLLIGWTGESSSTAGMVKQMYQWKEKNKKEYDRIMEGINKLVLQLISSLEKKEKPKIIRFLQKNEDYLRELGRKSGVNIETDSLAKLSSIANEKGAAGKLSGAGGGDCGIAIAFDEQTAREIIEEWGRNSILFIDVPIAFEGVSTES